MFERLEAIKERNDAITKELTKPEVISDVKKVTKLSKEQSDLSEIIECYDAYLKAKNDYEEAKELARDPEMKEFAMEEEEKNLNKQKELEKQLEIKAKEDIYKIVIAAKELSNEKTGGLIVIEREIQINDIMDTGVRIGADVSPQLLVNLFVPNTPLHDGAVVISNNKIEAAACILPLADDKELATGLGTRHRAAIGISRETDAIAVVVSEETGKISVAKDGTLIADVKEEVLKKILIKTLVTDKFRTEKKEHKLKIFSKSKEKQVQNNKKTE